MLDELHTYRGRQGADVALLVRRVREALADRLQCIGTSATMATGGTEADRNAVVAEVASRLFGTPIPPANVITETLQRVTPEAMLVEAGLRIEVENRPGVLAQVAAAIAHAESNIDRVEYLERDTRIAAIRFAIEVSDRKHLAEVIRRIRRLNVVHGVQRL